MISRFSYLLIATKRCLGCDYRTFSYKGKDRRFQAQSFCQEASEDSYQEGNTFLLAYYKRVNPSLS